VSMSVQIEAQNITFSYTHDLAQCIFRDISFAVRAGDVLCLLGPNGTGKSTLLKCLINILHVQRGQVLLNERNLLEFRLTDIAKRIGYVPQGLTSAFPFRIKDIIVMGRAPHLRMLASPSHADMDRAYIAMETVGLVHLSERPCNSVSGGEWQLALIARALVQEPQILLLDEPTSHLDLGNQMKILRVIKQLAGNGMTIVMASHFPDHAFLVANRVAILKEGQMSQMGAPEDVITEESLRSTYGVQVRIITLGDEGRQKACFATLEDSNTSGNTPIG
jgi:iron complex transport system ATP-binding protein